ncbi:hypothetical protein C0J52_02877 [Blattella germanica]|nr:hypothetical protein C0J52_02877 [Blattella germanica]
MQISNILHNAHDAKKAIYKITGIIKEVKQICARISANTPFFPRGKVKITLMRHITCPTYKQCGKPTYTTSCKVKAAYSKIMDLSKIWHIKIRSRNSQISENNICKQEAGREYPLLRFCCCYSSSSSSELACRGDNDSWSICDSGRTGGKYVVGMSGRWESPDVREDRPGR